MNKLASLTAFALAALFAACRGGVSTHPPVHLVNDMDQQPKLRTQSESHFAFWKDGRGMRAPVPGTVAQGSLKDPVFSTGKAADGSFLQDNPLPRTLENVKRGRERYDIHCSPCHDKSGAGNGIVMQRQPTAFAPRPHLAMDARLVAMADGELFQTISAGKNTMPAYGHQVRAADRWAIVHYLRVLQSRMK